MSFFKELINSVKNKLRTVNDADIEQKQQGLNNNVLQTEEISVTCSDAELADSTALDLDTEQTDSPTLDDDAVVEQEQQEPSADSPQLETQPVNETKPAPSSPAAEPDPDNIDGLTEVKITQVFQTSEGSQEEVDPHRFQVYNTARNQSLDIVIGTGAIKRSMNGMQGAD